jgi:hypothetical protein
LASPATDYKFILKRNIKFNETYENLKTLQVDDRINTILYGNIS